MLQIEVVRNGAGHIRYWQFFPLLDSSLPHFGSFAKNTSINELLLSKSAAFLVQSFSLDISKIVELISPSILEPVLETMVSSTNKPSTINKGFRFARVLLFQYPHSESHFLQWMGQYF